MKNTHFLKMMKVLLLLVTALFLSTAPSQALDLAAVEAQWTPPGAVSPVRMWGFVEDPGGCPAAPVAWGTGPLQVGTAGGSLSITLRNCLSEPVSLVIPGQMTTLNPQVIVDSQGRTRVSAFTNEAPAAGGTATYTWNNLQTGTFLYQSGSHPAKQHQMGLYGALTVGSYPGVTNELTLLFSEIDPALHGPLSPTAATPLTYKPKYFLINGQSYAPGEPVPVIATGPRTTTLLVRFLNAGLMSHTPVLQGPYMSVVAEDGNPYPYPREQYSVMLAAGKTMDAMWQPLKNGTYALYDRSLSLSSDGAAGGGMLVQLAVDVPPPFNWSLFLPTIIGAGIPAVP